MKLKIFLLSILWITHFSVWSQKINKQATYKPSSLEKDAFLGNVFYDSETNNTSLYYVEKSQYNTIFRTYLFDKDLNFIKEDKENYDILDQAKDDLAKIKARFSWFTYKGEKIESEYIDVIPQFGGKLFIQSVKKTEYFQWGLGTYATKYEQLASKEISGLEDSRLYLYERFNNSKTGEVVLLVGNKAPKGETKDRKYEHARNLQLLKIGKNLEIEYGDKIEFPYNMGVSFIRNINPYQVQEEGGMKYDIGHSDIALYFVPIKAMFVKDNTNPDPSAQSFVIINQNAKVVSRTDVQVPSSGWVIENLLVSPKGDFFLYGPAKPEAYANKIQPIKSPLTVDEGAPADIKYKSFQVMRVSAQGKLIYVDQSNLDDFEAKTVTPPSQKRTPTYNGKDFLFTFSYITQKDELIIGGQSYNTKNVLVDPSNPSKGSYVVPDEYKDVFLFHFENNGKLKSQYGVRRENNNKYAKANPTPQEVFENPEGTSLYWVYGEIDGYRKGLEIGGVLSAVGAGTLRKEKLLFYSAVSKINLEQGKLTDFVAVGANAEGKQLYYMHPEHPYQLSADGKKITFIGEDKKGTEIWIGNLDVE